MITRAMRKDEVLGASSISVWEIARLAARRRVQFAIPVDDWLDRMEASRSFAFYPVDNRIARRSVNLELGTSDPADRIIVATAIEHDATLITGDAKMQACKTVRTAWD